jgi:diguanylate cyclase (GGDEF)-like protein
VAEHAEGARSTTDCLVVVHTRVPDLLGRRMVLDHSPTRVGRASDNDIVLADSSIGRRHAHFEQRGDAWLVVHDGSPNGTYRNDHSIWRDEVLENGDRIKIGSTIFKFLSGAGVEAQYREELHRLTVMDGLTELHNDPYLHQALEREIIRGRRLERDLSILLLDIDAFAHTNDRHGGLAGDFVLGELARVLGTGLGRSAVLARSGGDTFAVILPERSLEAAAAVAETLCRKVRDHVFVFDADVIPVTVSAGAALLQDSDRTANDLIARAGEALDAGRRRRASGPSR